VVVVDGEIGLLEGAALDGFQELGEFLEGSQE
jgi:hypothetical protein